MKYIYKMMGRALTEARATPIQARLAFVMLEINGLASALNYIEEVKKHNDKRISNEVETLNDGIWRNP